MHCEVCKQDHDGSGCPTRPMCVPSNAAGCYVALAYHTSQVSEDSYRTFTKTKICTRDTTIGEVVDWYRLWNKRGPVDDLHISEAT